MFKLKEAGIWPYISLLLFIFSIYLIYVQVDTSVTLDHQGQARKSIENSNELYKKILSLLVVGKNETEITSMIKINFEKDYLVKTPSENGSNILSVNEIFFEMKDGKVISISNNPF